MSKFKKITLIILAVIIIGTLGFTVYYLSVTSSAKLEENKLTNTNRCITIYDSNGEIIEKESNGNEFISIEKIPEHVKNAFISIEDKRFYSHKGVDVKRLIGATIKNAKSFSFKEGASTITQQLIKNTHLSNEKTIKRKLLEIKLAKQLEKKYDKDKILETYLNHIYFGENCYGIECASQRYFNKSAEKLSINEGAILASIIKAPSYYSPTVNLSKCNARKNLVLEKMHEQNYLSKNEYESAIKQDVEIIKTEKNETENGYVKFAKSEFYEKINFIPYKDFNYEIKTFCDSKLQKAIQDKLNSIDIECEKSAILIDKSFNIIAYFSTDNDQQRQLGSIIKPLACYAPAIEENLVDSFTKILDEKTDFNGYSPSNFNDKYYGKITVKESLAKSSNVCAVKLLNYVTIIKAKNYLTKLNLPLTDNDVGLSLALGATQNGAKLIEITNAYANFINNGNYSTATTISNVDLNDKKHYQPDNSIIKVFSDDTVTITNDALRFCVTDGTAKKLSYLKFPVYAKTGTVGDENGNTDAYTISYNGEYVLGIRLSAKNKTLMDNSITGGTIPTLISKDIWENIYKDKNAPDLIPNSSDVQEIQIDKISYEEDEVVELSDLLSPNRYKFSALVKKSRIPNSISTRFTNPKIKTPKIIVNNNEIKIELCLTEYYNAVIYKEIDGTKRQVYDSAENNHSNVFIDKDILPNKTINYSVVPYFTSASKDKYYGEEIQINTIKTPSSSLGEKWWDDDL